MRCDTVRKMFGLHRVVFSTIMVHMAAKEGKIPSQSDLNGFSLIIVKNSYVRFMRMREIQKMGIVVIGAVFVDIKGFPEDNYIPNGRNAGTVEYIHGGVSRNVVENIANLELRPTFVSLVDDSALGVEVVQKLRRHKVKLDYVRTVPGGMGTWLAVFDSTGDVAGSISKRPDLIPILQILEEHGDEIFSDAESIVVEIDINKEIIKKVFELAEKYGKKVYAVVSNMSIAHPDSGPVFAFRIPDRDYLKTDLLALTVDIHDQRSAVRFPNAGDQLLFGIDRRSIYCLNIVAGLHNIFCRAAGAAILCRNGSGIYDKHAVRLQINPDRRAAHIDLLSFRHGCAALHLAIGQCHVLEHRHCTECQSKYTK